MLSKRLLIIFFWRWWPFCHFNLNAVSIRGRPGHICIATTTILEKRNKSYTTICRMLKIAEAIFFYLFPRLDHNIVVSTMTKENSTNTDSWLWFNTLNTIFGVILKNNQSVDLKHFFVVVVRVGGGQVGEGSEKLEKQYILVFLMAITRKHWYLSQPDYKYVWFYRQPELFKLELNHSLPCCHLRHHKCNV